MAGKDTKSTDRRWHAVSVKPGDGACNAAISGKNRRWLSREAPLCPCPAAPVRTPASAPINHHDDRRANNRRAEDLDAFPRDLG